MESVCRMGPVYLEGSIELTTACCPRSKRWFSYITNGKCFHFSIHTHIVKHLSLGFKKRVNLISAKELLISLIPGDRMTFS